VKKIVILITFGTMHYAADIECADSSDQNL